MSARQPISCVEARTSQLVLSVGLRNKRKCSNSGKSRDCTVLAVSRAELSVDSHKVWPCNKESIEIALLLLLDQLCLAKSRNNVASLGSTKECAHWPFGLLLSKFRACGCRLVDPGCVMLGRTVKAQLHFSTSIVC